MGRAQAERTIQSKNLAAALENARFQGMSGLASMGQARSPRFADRLRRQLTREELARRGQLERDTTMRLSSIEDVIANARRARDRQLLALESDEALQRTALERVFTPPTYRSGA